MNEIKIGAILNYLRLFLSLSIGLLLSPYILSRLGTAEYGIYHLSSNIISWLALCDFGISSSTTSFLSKYQAKKDINGEARYLGNLCILMLCISIFILIVGFSIFPFLDDLFPNFSSEELALLNILYVLMLLNASAIFPLRGLIGISNARQKFVIPGLINLASSILTAIGTITLLYYGFKSIALTILTISLGVLGMLLNVLYCFFFLNAKMKWNGIDTTLCRSMLTFSAWLFLDQIINMLNMSSGNIIIGMTCGSEEITVFSYGVLILSYYFMFSNNVSTLFLPKITKLIYNNQKVDDLWINVGKYQVFTLGLFYSSFLIFGDYFLDLWIGDTLGEKTFTVWLISIILITPITIPLIQNLGWQILQAKNSMHYRVKGLIIIAPVFVLIGYFASIYYSSIGLAFSIGTSYLVGQGVYMNYIYKKRIGLDVILFFKSIIRKSLIPAIFVALSFLFNRYILGSFENSWCHLAILLFIYCITYLLVLINFYFTRTDILLYPRILTFLRLIK